MKKSSITLYTKKKNTLRLVGGVKEKINGLSLQPWVVLEDQQKNISAAEVPPE